MMMRTRLQASARSLVVIFLALPIFAAALAFADGADTPPVAGGVHGLSSAAGAADAAASSASPGMGSMIVPFALAFGVMYFLLLRPQKKRAQEQSEMLTALKHGDEVLTASGILGKVTGITEKVVTLEVADDVRMKMLKTQISQVLKDQKIKDMA